MIQESKQQGTKLCNIYLKNTVNLGYNFMKVTGYFVSL